MMKPRLRAAPLTYEDVEIRKAVDVRFLRLVSPRALREWPSFSWIVSDRRDADLMHQAQVRRIGHWGRLMRYCHVGDLYTYMDFGGAVPGALEINETAARNINYFAT